jgi:hypothetical protein
MGHAVPVEIIRADAVRLLLGVVFGACGVAGVPGASTRRQARAPRQFDRGDGRVQSWLAAPANMRPHSKGANDYPERELRFPLGLHGLGINLSLSCFSGHESNHYPGTLCSF